MTAAEREARILSLERQVKYLADRKHATVTSVHLDELISAAWLGAIQAVDGFDESAGNQLRTYASWKIASAMADYLRSIDPLKRDHRRAIKHEESAPVQFLQQDPRDCNQRGAAGPIGRAIDGRAARAQVALDARITLEAIWARAELKPRSARVLTLWAQGGLMKEIGRGLHLTESRVSQICSRSIAKLREAA